MLGQTSYAGHGFLDLLLALKSKGDRHNADSQDTHLLRHFRYDRRSAGTGASTHAGRDEQHLRAVIECLADMITALLGVLTGGLRITTGTQTRA